MRAFVRFAGLFLGGGFLGLDRSFFVVGTGHTITASEYLALGRTFVASAHYRIP
jgi:hypothetical protein